MSYENGDIVRVKSSADITSLRRLVGTVTQPGVADYVWVDFGDNDPLPAEYRNEKGAALHKSEIERVI